MKPLTTTFAASALLALGACTGEQAGNDIAATNVAETADVAEATENAADAGKPVDGNAAAGDEAVPAGDKPAVDDALDANEAAADKPTE